jgi:Carboxypeptidase regulatory-like domain
MTRLSLATLLACALAAPALAQTAIVTGTVHDESGAAVPGATVELVGPATMTPTVSRSRGEYSFRDVRPGTYKIQATLVGFAPAMQNDIVVGTSNVEVPALTLRIASLTDTVVVSATKSERREHHQPPGDVDADEFAARAARRSIDLSRFLRHRAVGLHAGQHVRHQAD